MSTDNRGIYKWEDVYVFVSSTFNDMHAERDYLVKYVFPNLRDWCEQRKLRLHDIDLRWGVTEVDATRHKRVIPLLFDHIDKARPFFLCLRGQRVGWIPTKECVAEDAFAKTAGLSAAIEGQASVTEMEALYALLSGPFDGEAANPAGAMTALFYEREPAYIDSLPADPPPIAAHLCR